MTDSGGTMGKVNDKCTISVHQCLADMRIDRDIWVQEVSVDGLEFD